MTVITPVRIATVLGTVALAASALATTAAAGPPARSSDSTKAAAQAGELDPAIATAIAAHRRSVTAADKRSSTTKDAATRSGELDPAIATAVAAHRRSVTAAENTRDAVSRSGELDPAIATAVAAHRRSVTAADTRSHNTEDATGVLAAPTTTPQASVAAGDSVFDWTDAAIGAVAGFAIALLLGGMILLSTRGRHGSLAL